jgi:hypothetical protein
MTCSGFHLYSYNWLSTDELTKLSQKHSKLGFGRQVTNENTNYAHDATLISFFYTQNLKNWWFVSIPFCELDLHHPFWTVEEDLENLDTGKMPLLPVANCPRPMLDNRQTSAKKLTTSRALSPMWPRGGNNQPSRRLMCFRSAVPVPSPTTSRVGWLVHAALRNQFHWLVV